MADLSELNAAQTVKLAGADNTGAEQAFVEAVTATPSLAASSLVVRPLPFEPNTYSAGASGFASAANPTDIFTITGSASKTIRITKIVFSGTTTSGSPITTSAALIKRSTADTAGTRVAATVVPYDSTSAAGTATVGHYTANPTLGTTVGNIATRRISFQQTGVNGGEVVFDFEKVPVVLRGTSEQIALNLGATTVTGSLLSAYVEWQEV